MIFPRFGVHLAKELGNGWLRISNDEREVKNAGRYSCLARSIWKLIAMSNILVILFSVLDCNVWSIDQLTSWADKLIARLEQPKAWLADLSISDTVDECLEVIRKTMKESGVLLPDDIGDLMAGLILLRFDNGDLSDEAARSQVIDVIDAYGASCADAEAAAQLDLNDAVYLRIREIAEQAMKHLSSGQLRLSG